MCVDAESPRVGDDDERAAIRQTPELQWHNER